MAGELFEFVAPVNHLAGERAGQSHERAAGFEFPGGVGVAGEGHIENPADFDVEAPMKLLHFAVAGILRESLVRLQPDSELTGIIAAGRFGGDLLVAFSKSAANPGLPQAVHGDRIR